MLSGSHPKDIFKWRNMYLRKFTKFQYEKQESIASELDLLPFLLAPCHKNSHPEHSTLESRRQSFLPQLMMPVGLLVYPGWAGYLWFLSHTTMPQGLYSLFRLSLIPKGKNAFSPSPPSIPPSHLCPSSFIERSVLCWRGNQKTVNFCFPIVPNNEALISLMEEWVPSPVPSTFPLWPGEKQVIGQRPKSGASLPVSAVVWMFLFLPNSQL